MLTLTSKINMTIIEMIFLAIIENKLWSKTEIKETVITGINFCKWLSNFLITQPLTIIA